MIKLPLSVAVTLYIFIYVIALLLWWIYLEFKKSYKINFMAKGDLWQCSICTYLYTSSSLEEITVCPRCGSYNQKVVKS